MNDLIARVIARKFELYCKEFRFRHDCDPCAYDVWLELQKPALHEPVTDQETIDAIRACHLKVTTESMIDMRRTLESFLQGRAKPAQEEITDAERYQFAAKHCVLSGGGRFGWSIAPCTKAEWDRYLDATIRASKEEKT